MEGAVLRGNTFTMSEIPSRGSYAREEGILMDTTCHESVDWGT